MDASGWLSLLTQDVLGMHVFYLSSQSGLTSSMPVFYRERLNSWTSASWKVATHFPVMRPSSGLDPNFRTPGTLLKPPSAIGRLAGEQEPNGKKCPLHAQSSHGGAFMVLVHSGPIEALCPHRAFMGASSPWPCREAHIVRVGVTVGLYGHVQHPNG